MHNISAAWLYPIIPIADALQAWAPPMNNVLRSSLENPSHAAPSAKGLASMP
jgi:transporter family-2 protein